MGRPLFAPIDDILLFDGFAIDAYALAEINKMGRRKKPHAIAGSLQDGGQQMGCGTFAVGPGNVDGAIVSMWMAQEVVHGFAAFESGLIGMGSLTLEYWQLGIEVGEGLGIVHLQTVFKLGCKDTYFF